VILGPEDSLSALASGEPNLGEFSADLGSRIRARAERRRGGEKRTLETLYAIF